MLHLLAAPIINLAAGFVCILACIGIGSGLLRRLRIDAPPHWFFPIALLSGVAALSTSVILALVLGGGVRTLRITAVFLLCFSGYEIVWHLNVSKVLALPRSIARERWLAFVVLLALGVNLLIALAPSTKIDETFYHMLVPKRVVSDDGLRPYREPYEAAIYPQMAFQIGLSVLHAFRVPEAGNELSWGLSAALIVLIIGTVSELTGEKQAGWLFGGIAAVGIYTAVWHVTSGAHALGDLATVTAASLCLLPDGSIAWARGGRRLTLICLAGCTGASTKISLLPVCAAITLLAAQTAAQSIGWPKALGILVSVWAVLYSPLLIWSYIHTGSPFGVATASLFYSHFFDAGTIAQMALARKVNQTGLIHALKIFTLENSPGLFLGACVVAAGAWKRVNLRILLGFITGQIVLIALFLPHDFRFLGGLQFVVLILGAWALSFSEVGRRLFLRSRLLVIPLCLPWLAVQIYYARPFIGVDLGLTTRNSFMDKYVAFWSDFQILDRILPNDAVLYVTDARPPSFYAPRPVIFTLKDAEQDRPLYRFTVGEDEAQDPIQCTQVVYENRQAVSFAFRTPGRPPVHERLKVERCVLSSR